MSLTIDQIQIRTSFRPDADPVRQRKAGYAAYGAQSAEPAATSVGAIRDEVSLSPEARTAAETGEKAQSSKDAEIEALSRKKGQAREALERIRDEIKLVRKIWQYQPKEMAKQIARLAKELRDVLDDYKAVQKAMAKLVGNSAGGGAAPVVGADLSVPAASAAPVAEEAEGEPANNAEASEAPATSDAEVPAENAEAETDIEAGDASDEAGSTERAQQIVQYERVRLDQTPEAFELRGDLEFTGFVKGLTQQLRDAFGDVKRWAIGFKQDDKDSQKLYEETDKGLKELEKEITDFETDIRRAMPPSIWVSQPVTA